MHIKYPKISTADEYFLKHMLSGDGLIAALTGMLYITVMPHQPTFNVEVRTHCAVSLSMEGVCQRWNDLRQSITSPHYDVHVSARDRQLRECGSVTQKYIMCR